MTSILNLEGKLSLMFLLLTPMAVMAAGSDSSVASVPAPAAGVERAGLFRFSSGDRIEDSGVMIVRSSRMAPTESFEVVRNASGGRSLTSVSSVADVHDDPPLGRYARRRAIVPLDRTLADRWTGTARWGRRDPQTWRGAVQSLC